MWEPACWGSAPGAGQGDRLVSSSQGWESESQTVSLCDKLWTHKKITTKHNEGSHHQSEQLSWDFLGVPMVKTLCFHCRGYRFDHWWGN